MTMLLIGADNKQGFTLIELVFVSVILLALLGMAVPRLNRTYPYYALRSSGKDLAALMRYDQNRAIMEQTCYRLNLDLERSIYWTTRQVNPADNSGEDYQQVKTSLDIPQVLHQGLNFFSLTFKDSSFSGEKCITFHPDGYIDEVTIVIVNKTGDNLSVVTEGRIGRVTVKEND